MKAAENCALHPEGHTGTCEGSKSLDTIRLVSNTRKQAVSAPAVGGAGHGNQLCAGRVPALKIGIFVKKSAFSY